MIRMISPSASLRTVWATSKSTTPAARPSVCQRSLAVLDTVLFYESEGVGEDQYGVVKTDAVIAFVAFGLGFVPLEQDHGISVA